MLCSKRNSQTEHFKPTISVGTKKINDKVEIRVKDNGNGIPPQVLDKIFQPFSPPNPQVREQDWDYH